MLDELLSLLGYTAALHRCFSWELRYCGRRFGVGRRLGAGAGLVTQGGEEVGLVSASAAVPLPAPACVVSGGAGGCWVEGAGGSWKRVRLTDKLQVLEIWVALRFVH